MSKVVVTAEEFKALDYFVGNEGKDLEHIIKIYLKYNDVWSDPYVPLREMGFQKFVECLISGYEKEQIEPLKIFSFTQGIEISEGNSPSTVNLEIKDGNRNAGISLFLEEVEHVAKWLNKFISEQNN
jgi:hypothetical protein